jgi:hypothetical protein
MRLIQARCALFLGAMLLLPALAEAAVEEAYFSVTTPEAAGPPYPTSNAVAVAMLEDDGTGSLEPTATWSTTFSASGSIPNPHLELAAVGQGSPPAPAHNSVQYDLFYRGSAGDLELGSFFDITYRVAIQGQSGTTPDLEVSESYLLDGSLVASCNMGGHKAGGGGTGVGRVGGKMHLEDISLSVVDSGVSHTVGDSFFDIFFRLELDHAGPIDVNQPLARVTLTAQAIPEPSCAWLAAVGGSLWAARRRIARRRRG